MGALPNGSLSVNGDEEDPPPKDGDRTPAPEAAAQPAEGEPPHSASTGLRARDMRLDLAVGAAVLLVYAAAQILLLQGPHPFDPARYFQAAVRFPHLAVDLWTLRIGLVVPVRLAVLAFGPSEASLYTVPVAMGLLLTAAVYGSMLVLFHDRVVAASTALATVLNAVFLYRSSLLFPDTAAAATFTAGSSASSSGPTVGTRERTVGERSCPSPQRVSFSDGPTSFASSACCSCPRSLPRHSFLATVCAAS